MTRKHAERILDAYAAMTACDFDEKAIAALREVILDAMTEYRAASSPGITLSGTTPPNQFTTPNPNWGYTHVTCKNGGAE